MCVHIQPIHDSELSGTVKLLLCIVAVSKIQFRAEIDFFRFFLGRTDIISVLNFTGIARVTTEDLDETRSFLVFHPPNCLEL